MPLSSADAACTPKSKKQRSFARVQPLAVFAEHESITMDISPATLDDFKVLFDLINEAYEVETGDSGVAFKKTLRLVGDSELTGHL